ncbi:hypothetical protein SE91_14790 [Bradyrhizobium sp. DOA1]|nr:hypothetical protein SE91_14790 [Bradyrhizobium sp. DOA1]
MLEHLSDRRTPSIVLVSVALEFIAVGGLGASQTGAIYPFDVADAEGQPLLAEKLTISGPIEAFSYRCHWVPCPLGAVVVAEEQICSFPPWLLKRLLGRLPKIADQPMP